MPGPANRDEDAISLGLLGADHQLSRPRGDGAHRLDRVQNQVEQDLFHLNTIPLNRKQPVRKSGPDRDTILADCASCQHNHLIDRRIEIKTTLPRRRFLDVLADPIDDVSGAIGIANDTVDRFPDLADVRQPLVQKIQRRTGVVARAGDRLRDLVSQRGGRYTAGSPRASNTLDLKEAKAQLDELA
jgi:hypothetical protein